MSDYFTITGRHTGHRWLIEVGVVTAVGMITTVTARREWSIIDSSVAYAPTHGKTYRSHLTWWAMLRARTHVWWSDWRWHRLRLHAQKVRRAAQRGDRP